MMELNLQMQESNYNGKVKRRDDIKRHLEDLKASEQTLKMTDEDSGVKVELIDELIRKSVFLREQETSESGTLIDNSQNDSGDLIY